jgi:hypothetical protein
MLLPYNMKQLYMVVGPLKYTKALYGSFTLGDSYYFAMVNGSGSHKIVDIYYENDLTLIEFSFSRKGVK